MKRNSIDENRRSSSIDAAVGNVELKVLSLFPNALGIAVINEIAGNKYGSRVARSIRLQTLENTEELRRNICQQNFRIHVDDRLFLMGQDMIAHVLLEAFFEGRQVLRIHR